MNLKEIGNRLKKVRTEKNLTQTELAYKIGKTESSVRKYESGLIEAPLSVLYKISDILEVPLPYILSGQDNLDLTSEGRTMLQIQSGSETNKDLNLIGLILEENGLDFDYADDEDSVLIESEKSSITLSKIELLSLFNTHMNFFIEEIQRKLD